MPSPLVLVQGSPPPVDVTDGSTVTIQLADLAGVSVWEIACIDTDGGQLPATINAGLTIDPIAKSATFPFPSDGGSALIFQSVVNEGKDINGTVQSSYTCTFIIHSVLASGIHLFAKNEVAESNAAVGWTGHLNDVARAVPSAAVVAALAGATAAATPSTLALRDGSAACSFEYITVGNPGGFIPTVGALRMAGDDALYTADSSGNDIRLIGTDSGTVQISDNISGATIFLNTGVVFMNGTVQFDAGAGPISLSQVQSTTGAGHTWANYAQKGKAGSIGGTYTIGGGLGGTLHTNLPGDTQLDLRGAVSNVSCKARFLTDAGNLDISQTTASEISITSAVALTLNATGAVTINGSTGLALKNGAVVFDAAAGSAGGITFSQAQNTTGVGVAWSTYAQQGKAGSIGGIYTIGGGLGGTLHTNLPGDLQLDLRGAVSNVGPKARFLTDAGNLDINQTAASTISITSPVGLTLAVTGSYTKNVTGSEGGVVTGNTLNQTNGLFDWQVYGTAAGFTMTGNFYFSNASHVERLGIDVGNNNIRMFNGTGVGSGAGVLTIGKATTNPTTAASANTGILYVDASTGDLKYMGTSGTARLVASA